MGNLSYGSLFSGAGGFDLGFDAAGMSCSFQVEIDATARDVLARHWPDVPKHTDVREVGKHNLSSVDVLIGGFPCQDLSVAGARKGLQGGTRSGLFYELARIAAELRPRFLVFENVPGLLSSDDGRDFARVLRHLGDNGLCGGWRVLDAEGLGVAQHRRRVFGVFSRGRAGAECCSEILALRESLSRHPAEGGKARTDLTGDADAGSGMRGVVNALTASGVGTKGADDTQVQAGHFNAVPQAIVKAFGPKAHGGYRECERSTTLTSSHERARVAPICVTGHRTHSLTANGCDASEDGTGRGTPIVAFSCKDHGADAGPVSPTLRAMGHDASHANGGGQVAVAMCHGSNVGPMGTLRANNGSVSCGVPFVASGLSVRRLTPTECERLMGWPDGWTRYRADGREIKDGPRYRLCGNGVVGSVAEWIAKRIVAASGVRTAARAA